MRLRTSIGIAAYAVLLCSIVVHFCLATDEATGFIAVMDHLFDLLVAFSLTAILIAVGQTLCTRLGHSFASEAEEASVSLFLGAGVVGLGVLLVGLVGLLRPVPISLLLIICLVLTRQSWIRLYELIKSGAQYLTNGGKPTLIGWLYLCLIVILVLRAATPPTASDELIYHLPVTKAFVEHGRIYPMFDNSLGNFPFLIHMLYALCLLTGSDIAARLFGLFLSVGTSLAIFGFCGRYLTRRAGAVALFTFFGAGMVVEVATTSRIDASLAGMLFLCTYTMVNYLETSRRVWLWTSALLAGFGLGIKQTAAIWLALVGVMYLVDSLSRRRDSPLRVMRLGLIYTLIALATTSPWLLKNYAWFHNPFYPLVTGEVATYGEQGIRYFDENDERRLDAHFDVVRTERPEIVAAQEKTLSEAIKSRVQRHPLWWWELFLKPNHYLMAEPNHFPNYLFLIIPLLFLVRKPRWVLWLIGLSFAFVLAVTFRSWIARFLLPAYPTLTIAAAYIVVALSDRFKSKLFPLARLPAYVIASVFVISIMTSIHAISMYDSLPFLSGQVSRQDTIRAFTYYKPIDFVNKQLPQNARIFIIGAQLNYGIERNYLTDETWFATKWRRVLIRNASFEAVNDDLKRQGFTHIFFSPGLFTFAAMMGIDGAGGMELISVKRDDSSAEALRLGSEYQLLRNWSTFTLYKERFLEPVYTDTNGYQILRIK